MAKIACTHPGKMGDAIYALPTIKKLCELEGFTADFYTSEYCKPLKNLFEYQPYIDNFYISESYKIERMDIGVQPYRVPVDISSYQKVYHLGFRGVPNRYIPDFIAYQIGLAEIDKISIEYPEMDNQPSDYIVLAPRGESSFKKLFLEFLDICPVAVYIIGGDGDFIEHKNAHDFTGLDFLETTGLIANSLGFVGLMSSQLALANAFDIPKIAVHDGKSWDMRHVMYSDTNYYLVNPSPEDILEKLGIITTYSKTLEWKDYNYFTEHKHVENIVNLLGKAKHRFEHQHRKWEYGMVLNALRKNNTKTVLDVGGGGSVFAPSAAWLGMEVLQVDPGDVSSWVKEQESKLNKTLLFEQLDFFDFQTDEKFDAVTCISVIEHVENDIEFFKKLLSFVKSGGLLALTTDFHPSGEAKVGGHLRTYNKESLENLVSIAEKEGFKYYKGLPEYNTEHHVRDYNFVSLIMKRL